jgi:hypothetical protein
MLKEAISVAICKASTSRKEQARTGISAKTNNNNQQITNSRSDSASESDISGTSELDLFEET